MSKQVIENLDFFCPNSACEFHTGSPGSWHIRKGVFTTVRRPKPVQRFQCRGCKKNFCATTPMLEYRMKRRGLSKKIFLLFKDGLSNRQIGRALNVSESVVRHRLNLLGRQAFMIHHRKFASCKLSEPLSYDGVENFARSQYEPNYINQMIGMNSGYIYDFNFSPLNRKGRMSDRQKLIKAKLEARLGSFPKNAIRDATTILLKRMYEHLPCNGILKIASDQHYQYRQSIQSDLRSLRIEHATISAKAPRTFRHILFQVNHTDLLLRQHVKAFARETISFSKTHAAMILKYALFMAWKNYMRPQFIKRHRRNPKSNSQSPAMALGIEQNILSFREVFQKRWLLSQVDLSHEWRGFVEGHVSVGRVPTAVS